MNYLIPAWHALLDEWAYTIPKVEFDDAVSHIKVFQNNDVPFSLVISDYQPQLSTKLNQLTISPAQVFSSFDYLQGVRHLDSQVIDYRDFNWPSDAYFDYTNFHIIVMTREQPYAKICFDTQGKILNIDYFDNENISRRLLLDSRGFISREEFFKNGQPYQHIYYDEQGYWRINHDLTTDHVEVNKLFPKLTKNQSYQHLNDLLTEVISDHCLNNFNNTDDQLIVTLDDQAVVDQKIYLKYRPIFSLSRWHAYQKSLNVIKDNKNGQTLIVDNNDTKNTVTAQTGLNASIIPLFQSRFNLGHSQRLSQEHIGLFVESMTENEIIQAVELIYQRLLKAPKAEALTILSYSTEKLQFTQKCISQLKEKHKGEFILASEESSEVEEILSDQADIPKLTIKAQRIVTPAEIGHQFDSLRILVDWGRTVNEFLQVTAISTGIPQLCRQPTKQVQDYQNGLVCPQITDLNKGLDYYLGNLRHWNQSLVYNVQLMNQYSAAELLNKWHAVLAK